MLFFQLMNDRGWADLQDPCGVPDTTAIETQVNNVLFDRRQAPVVLEIKLKGITRAIGIGALVALCAGLGLAAFDDLVAVTVGTQQGRSTIMLSC
jgi:hypothetical protein